jgi:uncharacterized protein
MTRAAQIKLTKEFVRLRTTGIESGHDWWHISRVTNLALYINEIERMTDPFILEIASLLHDVSDSKFSGSDQESIVREIEDFLESSGMGDIRGRIIEVIGNVSFSKKERQGDLHDPLLLVLQDADRLDAIGAIGIARAFNYGGFRNRPIYDPDEKKNEGGLSTIAHFHEKLLKLKDMMNTETGKRIAESRHLFLEKYLEQFNNEWHMDLSAPEI